MLATCLLAFLAVVAQGCREPEPTRQPSAFVPTLSKQEAIAIASADARQGRDLATYNVDGRLEGDVWVVAFDPKNPDLLGGGPEYRIDAVTGHIRSKKYYQ